MPKRRKRNLTYEKVIETAIEIANEDGVHALTLASVAKQLGIRVPSLYNYVDSIENLKRIVKLWAFEQLSEALKLAAIGVVGKDAIMSIAQAYRGFAHQNAGIYPVILQSISPDDPQLINASEQIIDIMITVLRFYDIADDDMPHYVRLFRSTLHGFINLELQGGFVLNVDIDESYQHVVELLVQGVLENTQTPS